MHLRCAAVVVPMPLPPLQLQFLFQPLLLPSLCCCLPCLSAAAASLCRYLQVELAAACVGARAALAQGRDADAFKAAQVVSAVGAVRCTECCGPGASSEGTACSGWHAGRTASGRPRCPHSFDHPGVATKNQWHSMPMQCMEVARRSFTAAGSEDRRWQVGWEPG